MTRRILTDEEMRQCDKWSLSLQAARANYLLTPGRSAMLVVEDIYRRVTGTEPERSRICAVCDLQLLKKLAGWYDETKLAIKEAKVAAAPKKDIDETRLSGAAARSHAAKKAKEAQA